MRLPRGVPAGPRQSTSYAGFPSVPVSSRWSAPGPGALGAQAGRIYHGSKRAVKAGAAVHEGDRSRPRVVGASDGSGLGPLRQEPREILRGNEEEETTRGLRVVDQDAQGLVHRRARLHLRLELPPVGLETARLETGGEFAGRFEEREIGGPDLQGQPA